MSDEITAEPTEYICIDSGVTEMDIDLIARIATWIKYGKEDVKKERIDEQLEHLTQYGNTLEEVLGYFTTHCEECKPCSEEYKIWTDMHNLLSAYVEGHFPESN